MRLIVWTPGLCLCALTQIFALHAAEPADHFPGLLATYSDANNRVTGIVGSPSFTLSANESVHPFISPHFTAVYEGLLQIQQQGKYVFSGAGQFLIDDKASTEEPIELAPGLHPIKLSFQRADGAARLQLLWRSDRFMLEPIPDHLLSHSKVPDNFVHQQVIERGKQLAEDLNCSACHLQLNANSDTSKPHAPDLSKIGSRTSVRWLAEWLKSPSHFNAQAAMPEIELSEIERRDIATYLAGLTAPAEPELEFHDRKGFDPRDAMTRMGCTACHNEKTLPLKGTGSKMNRKALTRYLLDPLSCDPRGVMPKMFFLNEQDAEENARVESVDKAGHMSDILHNRRVEMEQEAWSIAGVLAQSHNPDFERPVEPGNAQHGEELVQSKGCLLCHRISPDNYIRFKLLNEHLEEVQAKQSPWKVIGPFENGGNHTQILPPEREINLNAEYDDGVGARVRWQDGSAFEDGKVHDLFDKRPKCDTYFFRTVDAANDAEGTLYLGSDDTIIAWVNGIKVHEFLQGRGMPEEKDRVTVHINKGSNTILLKIGNDTGDYQFYYKLGRLFPALKNELQLPAVIKDSAHGCLAQTQEARGTAPKFELSPEDRAALVAFLSGGQTAHYSAPAYELSRSFAHFRCTACHTTDLTVPAQNLAEAPPTLKGAGAKLQSDWLKLVLFGNKRIRPWMKLQMPQFGQGAMEPLVHQIAAASGCESTASLAALPRPQEIEAGIRLIGKGGEGLGCIACHDFRGQSNSGVRGPDMTGMSARLSPEWFQRWLMQPSRIQAGTAMPTFFAEIPASEAQRKIHLIWAALSMGTGMPKPAGLDDNAIYTISVQQQPVLVRTAMPDSSPRSIAVGLDGFVSYCFDASACQVRYAWYGGFLDAKPLRTGLGTRAAAPLGARFYTSSEASLRIGDAQKIPRTSFHGYKLINGFPEFHYEIDGVSVSETVENTKGKTGLILHFSVNSETDKPIFFQRPGAPDDSLAYSCDDGTWEHDLLKINPGKTKDFRITLSREEHK